MVISQTSIVFPFLLGVGAAFCLYDVYSPPEISFLSFTLFLGIAMSITAFPVLARILTERNLFATKVGTIAITCAAANDVTAWCILAIVVAVSRTNAVGQAIWTFVLSTAFIALMWFVVRPLLKRWIGRHGDASTSVTLLAIAMLLLLTSSAITETIGIHALFGAFLIGAIFPRGKLAEVLEKRMETVAMVLLLPLFFASSGLRTDIGLLAEPREWLVTLAIIGLATAGKFGGSTLAARVTGLNWRESSAIGILMNTRGLMELVALSIGRELGGHLPDDVHDARDHGAGDDVRDVSRCCGWSTGTGSSRGRACRRRPRRVCSGGTGTRRLHERPIPSRFRRGRRACDDLILGSDTGRACSQVARSPDPRAHQGLGPHAGRSIACATCPRSAWRCRWRTPRSSRPSTALARFSADGFPTPRASLPCASARASK